MASSLAFERSAGDHAVYVVRNWTTSVPSPPDLQLWKTGSLSWIHYQIQDGLIGGTKRRLLDVFDNSDS
jgi:hypothetical protein